jgi:hypothetical protein
MKLVFAILFLFPLVGFATPAYFGEATPYDTILEWDAHAKPTTVKASEGVFRGKCFDYNNKSTGVDVVAVILTRSTTTGGNNGPGFPPTVQKESKVYILDYTDSTNTKAKAGECLMSGWNRAEISLQPTSELHYSQTVLMGELKLYNSWLVDIEKFSKDVPCLADHPQCKNGIVPKGAIYSSCYYYEELK